MKALLLAAALLSGPALAASPIEGNWTNPSGNVTIRIAPCGGSLCGRVVKASAEARQQAAAGGTPNLIGAELLSDLDQTGEGAWHGRVFVPDANRHAEADLHLTGPRTLDIQGCALGGMLCRSQTWTRAAAASARTRRRR